MSHPFAVRQVDVSFQAHFTAPVFGLFQDLPSLLQKLFGSLGPQGLRLAETKLETSGESLAEVHLRCFLFGETTLRIFLDHIEVASLAPNLVPEGYEIAAVRSVEALLEHVPALKFRTYISKLGIQGLPMGITVGELIPQGAGTTCPDLGPPLGMGAVFYYGALRERLAASVTLDLSRAVENGLFVQTSVIYDAQQIAAQGVGEASRRFLSDVLGHFGLVLEG